MARRPLVWKLFPTYFLITLVSVLIIGFYAASILRSFYYSQAEADLEVRTRLIAQNLTSKDLVRSPDELQSRVRYLGRTSGTRVTVISASGVVLADSTAHPKTMENHSDRPEFMQAMRGKTGRSRRLSPTLGITMLYAAVPMRDAGRVVGVIRASYAANALDTVPLVTYHHIFALAILTALFAGLVSFLAARRISEPLKKMKRAAGSFAGGDFRSTVPSPDTEEFASLADALNRMATRLGTQVRTITQQATEQTAILSSMKEGVIAIDNADLILILNPMAEQLLGVPLDFAKGRTIQEAIRNPDLQRFLGRSRSSPSTITDEFALRGEKEVLVQVTGTSLKDVDGNEMGVLVVINDITQTRKLESLRKDFVANVSHELKTPVTSIKGFVETLIEGAAKDPIKLNEFLEIIARQADRLQAIIEDLLSLSRIEQETETADRVSLELKPIKSVLSAAVVDCEPKASKAGVEISLECGESLNALINGPLLEQAVANLIDNAIKYTPGGSVIVKGEKTDHEVVIRVIDTGLGIEPEHIPRLFERFYRVDKARSRKLGGTGLGLAIVKHIAQAHHARVDVQSVPGKGSTFSIYLPASK